MIGRIFWNSEQNRLRAVWRIPITISICLALLLGVSVLGAVIVAVTMGVTDPDMLRKTLESNPIYQAVGAVAAGVAIYLTTWLAGRWIDRRSFASFGFHLNGRWWADLGFGVLLGAVLMALIFAAELSAGWVRVTGMFLTRTPSDPFPLEFLIPLIAFISVGFYEEMMFRGYLLKNIAEGGRAVNNHPQRLLIIAYLVSSAVFGLAHLGNPNATWVSTFNIFLAGLVLGLGYLLTGEMAIGIGLHIGWNLFQGNVFGFPVSGGTFAPPTVVGIVQGGSPLFTGGDFGPEAGLVGIAALMMGSALIAGWVRWRYGKIAPALALAEPPPPRAAGRLPTSADLPASSV